MVFDTYLPADVVHHHSNVDHHVVSFAAKNRLNDDPLSKELEALRTSTMQSADINSARLINRELVKASDLFGDLARATKRASEDAMSATATATKMSSMGPLGLMMVALAPVQQVKTQNGSHFL